MPARPPDQVVNLVESAAYRSCARLRGVNRRLEAANKVLRRMNGELLAENEDLYRENLVLLLRLKRIEDRGLRRA